MERTIIKCFLTNLLLKTYLKLVLQLIMHIF